MLNLKFLKIVTDLSHNTKEEIMPNFLEDESHWEMKQMPKDT